MDKGISKTLASSQRTMLLGVALGAALLILTVWHVVEGNPIAASCMTALAVLVFCVTYILDQSTRDLKRTAEQLEFVEQLVDAVK